MTIHDEMFKIIGMVLAGCFLLYLVVKMIQLQRHVVEGMTSGSSSINTNTTTNTSGEAGSAESYAASIKAQTVKLQDTLLVSKYRTSYENAIIQLDDLVGYLMLQQVLRVNTSGDTKSVIQQLQQLNTLYQSKDALNAAMVFLDKQ